MTLLLTLLTVAHALDCKPPPGPGALPSHWKLFAQEPLGTTTIVASSRSEGLSRMLEDDSLVAVDIDISEVDEAPDLALWITPPVGDDTWVGTSVAGIPWVSFVDSTPPAPVVPTLLGVERKAAGAGPCGVATLHPAFEVETESPLLAIQLEHSTDNEPTVSWWLHTSHPEESLLSVNRRRRWAGVMRARTINAYGDVSDWSESIEVRRGCTHGRGTTPWLLPLLLLARRRAPPEAS